MVVSSLQSTYYSLIETRQPFELLIRYSPKSDLFRNNPQCQTNLNPSLQPASSDSSTSSFAFIYWNQKWEIFLYLFVRKTKMIFLYIFSECWNDGKTKNRKEKNERKKMFIIFHTIRPTRMTIYVPRIIYCSLHTTQIYIISSLGAGRQHCTAKRRRVRSPWIHTIRQYLEIRMGKIWVYNNFYIFIFSSSAFLFFSPHFLLYSSYFLMESN